MPQNSDESLIPISVILFAGPSGSGKTTMMNRLQSQQDRHLSALLGVIDPDTWHFVNIGHVLSGKNRISGNTIVHFDLTARRPDDALKILRAQHSVTVVTLRAPRALLVLRTLRDVGIRAGVSLIRMRAPEATELARRLRKRLSRYSTPARYRSLYEEWFEVVEAIRPVRHVLVDVRSGGRWTAHEESSSTGTP